MKFELDIEVGRDTMEYYANICSALIYTITDVQRQHPEHLYQKPEVGDQGEIIDVNGHKIGKWKITGDDYIDSIDAVRNRVLNWPNEGTR